MVVFGGMRGRAWLNDVLVLEPRGYRWQPVRTYGKAPLPRTYAAAAMVGSRLVRW